MTLNGDSSLVDLDAARAARAETVGERHIKLGGEQFNLPAELPWDFFDVLDTGDMKAAMEMLLNGQFERFWKHQPTTEDMKVLAKSVPSLYGFGGNPESSASGGSSVPAGNRSRPTSPATTRSTSARRATGRKRSG